MKENISKFILLTFLALLLLSGCKKDSGDNLSENQYTCNGTSGPLAAGWYGSSSWYNNTNISTICLYSKGFTIDSYFNLSGKGDVIWLRDIISPISGIEGSYEISLNDAPSSIEEIEYDLGFSSDNSETEWHQASEGKLDISIDNNVFTIKFEGTGQSGEAMSLYYHGELKQRN